MIQKIGKVWFIMINVVLEDINGKAHFEQFDPLEFNDTHSVYSSIVTYANSINCRVVEIN